MEHDNGCNGNALVMRKTLLRCKEILKRTSVESASFAIYELDHIKQVLSLIDSALAEPCRNCDVLSIASDPKSAWKAWLTNEDNWDACGFPKIKMADWLLSVHKEGGESHSDK